MFDTGETYISRSDIKMIGKFLVHDQYAPYCLFLMHFVAPENDAVYQCESEPNEYASGNFCDERNILHGKPPA